MLYEYLRESSPVVASRVALCEIGIGSHARLILIHGFLGVRSQAQYVAEFPEKAERTCDMARIISAAAYRRLEAWRTRNSMDAVTLKKEHKISLMVFVIRQTLSTKCDKEVETEKTET